jgi:tryptophan synthase alpha subunit
MIGFGIENRAQFNEVTELAAGGIIGSAFLRKIETASDVIEATRNLLQNSKDNLLSKVKTPFVIGSEN